MRDAYDTSPDSVSSSQDLDSILRRLERFGVRLGLETTRRLLEGLGDPQLRYPVVLVAGTNGKGSTAALLAAMSNAAGYRTGLYTSPHLETVEERIRVNGIGISRQHLEAVVSRVVESADRVLGHAPTYFEALTSAAFDYFAKQEVDLAVFEVGLGGRLDATNAAEPVLSLITQIGLEHQRFLGDTLTSIAREKAGILRGGIPAIAWLEHPETRKAVKEQAEAIGADLVFGPDMATVAVGRAMGFSGQELRIRTSKDSYGIETPLIGSYQRPNLALAVLASELLAKNGYPRLTAEAITKGAHDVRWPGRLEMVELAEGPSVLLDVAHNPDGALALRSFLDEQVQPYDLLFGALEDKEVSAVLPLLAESASRVILTAPNSPRALAPETLLSLIASPAVAVERHSEAALSRALGQEGQLLVICGSVYLVGEIRLELRRRFGRPAAAVDLVAAPSQLGGS